MTDIIHIIAKLLHILPVNIQNILFEIALSCLPIRLIKTIPCSYSSYLKCYFPKKGDVVIDCGANIGNCAILFSRCVGRTGLVVALEPFEESLDILKKRINRLKRKNIIAINKGVWRNKGLFALKIFPDTISCKIEKPTSHAELNHENIRRMAIECITLDELTAELSLTRLDMIKMDIEGAEIEALQGSEKTLMRFSPCVAIASYHHRNNQTTSHEVEAFLRTKGYMTRTFFPPHLTTCGKRLK